MSHARIAQTAEALSRTLSERCTKVASRKLSDNEAQGVLASELSAGFKHLKDEGFLHEVCIEKEEGSIHIECILFVPLDDITVTFKVLPSPPGMQSDLGDEMPLAPADALSE